MSAATIGNESIEFDVALAFVSAHQYFKLHAAKITRGYYDRFRHDKKLQTSQTRTLLKKINIKRFSTTLHITFNACAKYYSRRFGFDVYLYEHSPISGFKIREHCKSELESVKGQLRFYMHYGVLHFMRKSHRLSRNRAICNYCDKVYSRNHKLCGNFCAVCHVSFSLHTSSSKSYQVKKYCKKCKYLFPSKQCFELHKITTSERFNEENVSTCDSYPRCKTCATRHANNESCSKERICKLCHVKISNFPDTKNDIHKCFVQSLTPNKTTQSYKIVFYDIETYVERVTKKLVPNLICYQIYKAECNSLDVTFLKRGSYSREACIDEFIDEFFPLDPDSDENKNVSFIAHNASRFDNYFIFRRMFSRRPSYKPQVLQRGTIIYTVKYPGMRCFYDSALVIPSTLKSFTKTFDIVETKGYFPHKFNDPINYNYVGPYPSVEFYDEASFRTESDLIDFRTWYNEQNGNVFDFWTELETYCHADVELLARGFLKFQSFILNQFKIHIFSPAYSNVLTLASLSMFIFRARYYKQTCLLNIPHNRFSRIFSSSCVSYLNALNIASLIHAGNNNGEVKIGNFHVDGYDPNSRTIYEYLGCFFHGHNPDCPILSPRRISSWKEPVGTFGNLNFDEDNDDEDNYDQDPEKKKPPRKRTVLSSMRDRRRFTDMRHKLFRKWNYNVSAIWECDARHLDRTRLKKNLLNPGDAVRGGRCEVFTIHSSIKDENRNDEISYYDVTSLYPFVLCSKSYPIGDVDIRSDGIQLDEWNNISNRIGIACVQVLPPRNLLIPVLPFNSKCNAERDMMRNDAVGESDREQKVFFPLCRTCVEFVISARAEGHPYLRRIQFNESYQVLTVREGASVNQTCRHTEKQRSWWGVYSIPELSLAIEKGYQLLHINEIWTFKEDTTELFAPYIKECFKIKLQNSGFPEGVCTQEQKREYVEKIKQTEGVTLQMDKIVKNPTGRVIGKNLGNCFFGKFLQHSKGETKYAMNKHEVKAIIVDAETKGKVIESMNILENGISCFYIKNEDDDYDEDSLSKYGNVIIGALTTSYARIELYRLFEKLDFSKLVMCDTDSIVYEPHEKNLTSGSGMGKLKNEIVEDFGTGARLVEIVCIAPKHYAMRVILRNDEEKEQVKTKGYSQRIGFQDVLNFQGTKHMIMEDNVSASVKFDELKRNRRLQSIFQVVREKKIQAIFDKRVVDLETLKTVPIGYNLD